MARSKGLISAQAARNLAVYQDKSRNSAARRPFARSRLARIKGSSMIRPHPCVPQALGGPHAAARAMPGGAAQYAGFQLANAR
jgi:hypothetical protein